MPWIHDQDAIRFHKICRMMEDDLHEAYFSSRRQHGADITGAILICLLRQKFNTEPNQWPPPEDLIEKVNDFLRKQELME